MKSDVVYEYVMFHIHLFVCFIEGNMHQISICVNYCLHFMHVSFCKIDAFSVNVFS